MKLDITPIVIGKKDKMEFSFGLMPEKDDGYALLPDGVSLAAPCEVDADITDASGFIKASFSVFAKLDCVCMRCLDRFTEEIEFSFDRACAPGAAIAGYSGDEDGETIIDIQGGMIDPTADIMEELSLEAPEYPLCSEDCPGICPKCGKKLSDGACQCEKDEKKRTDPRMDVFRKLLDEMENEEDSNEK